MFKQTQPNTAGLIRLLLENENYCDTCGYKGSSKKKPQDYDHWRKPSDQEAHNEWNWEYTSKVRPHFGELWPTKEHLAADVAKSPMEAITPEIHNKLGYATHVGSISGIKSMTSGYQHPRDVDSIVKGFHEHDSIPTPIVLKHTLDGEDNPRYRIMSGNTRTNSAVVHGVTPKATVIDVTDHLKRTGKRF